VRAGPSQTVRLVPEPAPARATVAVEARAKPQRARIETDRWTPNCAYLPTTDLLKLWNRPREQFSMISLGVPTMDQFYCKRPHSWIDRLRTTLGRKFFLIYLNYNTVHIVGTEGVAILATQAISTFGSTLKNLCNYTVKEEIMTCMFALLLVVGLNSTGLISVRRSPVQLAQTSARMAPSSYYSH